MKGCSDIKLAEDFYNNCVLYQNKAYKMEHHYRKNALSRWTAPFNLYHIVTKVGKTIYKINNALYIGAFIFLLFMQSVALAGNGDGGVVMPSLLSYLSGENNTLSINSTAVTSYTAGNETSRKIKNVITLSIIEETGRYIPINFTAKVKFKIEYGHSAGSIQTPVIDSLTVDYNNTPGVVYNARKYVSFEGAEYVKLTVLDIDAPASGSFDSKTVLLLQNEIRATRYFQLANNVQPINFGVNTNETRFDALVVNWHWDDAAGNNGTQLEWTWIENEMEPYFKTGLNIDVQKVFSNNATRVDLAYGKEDFTIPLFYDGVGKVYFRIRPVNYQANGTRIDGSWSNFQTYAFNGHNDSLNWQVTTNFAEEGKYKTVISYFDGSLRSRQTITKDNTTNTTVVAETFYDAQGRAAIQVLPAPTAENIVRYRSGFNLFKANANLNLPGDQVMTDDPVKYFDLEPIGNPTPVTAALTSATGAAKYYSDQNDNLAEAQSKDIADAQGYPYSVIRYTPDATGRVMSQSGVGLAMRQGGGHVTKYYYGTAAQEELDGLFGTEAGNNTHYFKNMVQDANGQMSVSYVDMHGRTIATALAGDSTPGIRRLNLNTTDYPNQQGGETILRDLLGATGNIIKGKDIEAISTLLLPAQTSLNFRYELTPLSLQLPQCAGPVLCYDCMYDLEIAITEESGDMPPVIQRFNNIQLNADDDCATPQGTFINKTDNSNIITWNITLPAGSYAVRKTLTVSQASIERYREMYVQKALCKSDSLLIDSLYQVFVVQTNCGAPKNDTPCKSCIDSLGSFNDYKTKYLANLNTSVYPNDTVLQAFYNRDIAHCQSLCTNISHALGSIKKMMLADMMPYTGQYAKSYEDSLIVGAESMYMKYDIFSAYGVNHRPFYKNPWKALGTLAGKDFYYDINHNKDISVHLSGNNYGKLDTMKRNTFANVFSPVWAESLLPHHPEYQKLVFAETYLVPVYDWGVRFSMANTWAQANDSNFILTSSSFTGIPKDPLFALPDIGSVLFTRITDAVSTNYLKGLSMWQIAYGDAKCKTIVDATDRKDCYFNPAHKQPPFADFSSFTTLEKNMAWKTFQGLYMSLRDSILNAYIEDRRPLGADADDLVAQKYKLHFPFKYQQTADQYGWDWLPDNAGDGPYNNNYPSLSDSLNANYSSRCSSYIEAWRTSLSQCDTLKKLDSATREHILNLITSRMKVVCEKGSNESHPYGSSNVAPEVNAIDNSFEQVIEDVLFNIYHLPKTMYCNPYVIEFPKPYAAQPEMSKTATPLIDTCNCSQLVKLKAEAQSHNYNANSLTGLNQYLLSTYKDTISAGLYAGLLQCNSISITCKVDKFTRIMTCDTVRFVVLPQAQPLPEFLKCGFAGNTQCLNCEQVNNLINQYKAYFSGIDCEVAPIFGTTVLLTPEQVNYNRSFARYVNYKTGFQYNWMDYAKAVKAAGCIINGGDTSEYSFPLPPVSPTVICGQPLNDTTGMFIPNPPCKKAWNMAVAMAEEINRIRRDSLRALFENAYIARCLAAKDSFTVKYLPSEYHYTLYYYDQAGNLVKTVPPKGVRPNFSASFLNDVKTGRKNGTVVTPAHTFATNYRYNSLNQVIAQQTPDAGLNKFWYDRLGRLVVSQNAKQKATLQTEGGEKYSYTVYDALGRIVEVGQKPNNEPMSQLISQDDIELSDWLNGLGDTKEQITYTVYDVPYIPITGLVLSQQNLRNRVSYTATKNLSTDALHYTATYYSYDIHGNVDTLLQDYKGIEVMNAKGQRFKKIVYEYDLISGKVNQVLYQPQQLDAFYHRYHYDAENRLISVETSDDQIYWEREALYSYYKHGPLDRTVIGKLQVQGLDHSYTLQGWLKGVNPEFGGSGVTNNAEGCAVGTAVDDLDINNRAGNAPGLYAARNSISFNDGFVSLEGDAFETEINSNLSPCVPQGNGVLYTEEQYPVARDVFGFSLHYYNGDYKPISQSNMAGVLAALGANAAPLYNGNIASMAVNIPKLGTAKVYAYQYDQLNRLVAMNAYDGLNVATGSFAPVSIEAYRERIAYDPNGNIMQYDRNGSSAQTAMDRLSYHYINNTNKLASVSDAVSSGNYNEDIDNQAANNYEYDEIGNLVKDNAEGIIISWTVYGKIETITKTNSNIRYTYDAAGNRITKKVNGESTIYVRDASGNVMSVYNHSGELNNPLNRKEAHIYGSSRLGINNKQINFEIPYSDVILAEGFGDYKRNGFVRGEKIFELANHLGNVLVTVSDKKLSVDQNNDALVDYYEADVMSAQDYYTGGMDMPGRQYNATNGYRYGFNGKEKDNKDGVVQYDYGFRIYDPRLVRFKSVDPLTKSYPWYTPYQFAGNKPIACIDLDGLEELWITNNCFAPFDLFGSDLFGSYTGDGEKRKFGDGGTYRTSGTAHINLKTAEEPTFVAGNTTSSYVRKFGADYVTKSPSKIEEKYYYASDNRNYHHLQMHVSGSNDAVALNAAPHIDNHVNIYLERNPQDKNKVLVHGYVQGDHFPANETILSDKAGNKIIAGVSGPGAGKNIGPYTLLWGDTKRDMYKFSMTILFNDDETFKAVEINGKQYSLEDWNKMFSKQNAQSTGVTTTTNNTNGTTEVKDENK